FFSTIGLILREFYSPVKPWQFSPDERTVIRKITGWSQRAMFSLKGHSISAARALFRTEQKSHALAAEFR
ncbi:MAG: hypothetical protein ABF491_04430, partial [Acetobacter sp.]|uniref:hypothetical protein n=1 Tax=Acetobacter sp. TaxID=440 RepID=UPI0039E9E8A0